MPIPMPKSGGYYAYLLRGWSEDGRDNAEGVVWRFRLQDLQTGQEHGFTNVHELASFLRQAFAQYDE